MKIWQCYAYILHTSVLDVTNKLCVLKWCKYIFKYIIL
jgi:hypothetical protein